MKTLTLALKRVEQTVLVATLALVTIIPLAEVFGPKLVGFHVPGAVTYVKHLTLWLAFVGGLAAASQAKHLTLSTAEFLGEGRVAAPRAAAGLLGVGRAWSASSPTRARRSSGSTPSSRSRWPFGVPEWVSEIIMPVSLGLMALVFAWKASDRWWGRLVALLAIPAVVRPRPGCPPGGAPSLWPLALVILAAALLGAPVFVAMGGIALLLFFRDGTPVAAVSAEVYRLVASETLPAIPLLTAAGYVLAESAAAERLVRFFRAIFGWMPGGIAVMVAAVCALFTTFTGGSGVTIIALGGLVYPILRKDGYSGGLLARPGHGGRQPRPALPAEPAGHPLQRRRVSVAQPDRAGRRPLPRRAAAGPAARRADGVLRHPDRPPRPSART